MDCGKRGDDELGVFVGVRGQGPRLEREGILVVQPGKALLQFAGEQAPVKAHALQDGFAKFQHRFRFRGESQDAHAVHFSCHNEIQQT